MKWSAQQPYYTLSNYYKQLFGEKTYKLSLDIGLTCPNRDGTLDHRGCIFCSGAGSGDFATLQCESIDLQINKAKALISSKYKGSHFIAYFQSFTNTYGPIHYLKDQFMAVINHPDICGLSIATRPDCLPAEVLDLLDNLNQIKPVWVELGLQTIHDDTADFIRRCYPLEVFDMAIHNLHKLGLKTVIHLIAGLPHETKEDFIESVDYVSRLKVHGVKLQLLHILKNTDLAKFYDKEPFDLLTMDEYASLIVQAVTHLNPSIVVHRLTGDGNKNELIAPLWSGNKRQVLNRISNEFKVGQQWQGKFLENLESRQEDER